ncbi:MAG: DNA adenine methylase [Candidatus Pacearchaeota archaeon]|nr:DNA adenine methylase [Candidatus Pacearchaeota archaeon]
MKTEDLKKTDNPNFVHSPLRYPGNQIYALDTLLSLIPEHRYYAEPFCGGASTFFGKPKAEGNWLNDVDRELIETYIAIRDQPEKLFAALTGEEISEKRYNHFKTGFTPRNGFETAVRWFYLNRTSRLETMSRYWEYDNKITSLPVDWSNIILGCSKKLQGVRLTSGDFGDVLDKVPEEAFLFIAPPYSIHHSSAQNRLHKYPFEREAHFRLANALKLLDGKVKFLVVYNENEELRSMYSWGEHIVISNLPNKSPQKEEIVIMNYKL